MGFGCRPTRPVNGHQGRGPQCLPARHTCLNRSLRQNAGDLAAVSPTDFGKPSSLSANLRLGIPSAPETTDAALASLISTWNILRKSAAFLGMGLPAGWIANNPELVFHTDQISYAARLDDADTQPVRGLLAEPDEHVMAIVPRRLLFNNSLP
jgi:hypothetical protein